MSLLSIRDLSIQFHTETGVTDAVKNISFDVNRGEIVAIVGESGSGKSVTALSVLRLLPAVAAKYPSGQILFADQDEQPVDLLQLPGDALRKLRGKKISMIFQEPMTSLNPVYTCGDQVMEAIRLHEKVSSKIAKERTIALFQQVKLPDPAGIFDRYPHQLSGGQKQRVMIAMAMSCNPSLLICDEPTTALDVTVQKNILQLIKELQQATRMGVIFITHDLGLVGEIADRAVVMYKGEIVEQGRTGDIFSSPKHPYTKALLACRPGLHQKGERLPTVSDFMGPKAEIRIDEPHADKIGSKSIVPGKSVPDKSDSGKSDPGKSDVADTRIELNRITDIKVPDTDDSYTNIPDNFVPDKSDSGKSDSGKSDPGKSDVADTRIELNRIPDIKVPETNVPDKSVPDESVLDKSVADKSFPDENVTDESVPDKNRVFSDAYPDNPKTKDPKSSDFRPTDPRPINPTHSQELLQVQNLSVWFSSSHSPFAKSRLVVKAVDNVSFTVFKGETLGLVGESGCGKTTLGRTLLRLITPTSGKIIYNSKDLATVGGEKLKSLRKDIQIIFQDPYSSLNPRITIGHAISEPLKVHGLINKKSERRDHVVSLLEKVSLRPEHYNRYPHEFSGGQRQRIVIARALALNPSFLVCDESVSALDVSVQAQVLNLLNDLKKEYGFTIVFISHDLAVVHYVSDRIMVMNKGKIEEIGTADEVYYHPRTAYTRKLVESVPKGIKSNDLLA